MDNLDNTLDEMVDLLLQYEEIPFLDRVQQIWRQGWLLKTANEPEDVDPLRRALKASLLERMVEIWNAPPKNSNEEIPAWCASVPAVTERFSVIPANSQIDWSNEPTAKVFLKRNIFAPKEFMFFL